MCGPGGIPKLAKAVAGVNPLSGAAALTSGGIAGASPVGGLSAIRAMSGKKKAAKLPVVPILGVTGGEQPPA